MQSIDKIFSTRHAILVFASVNDFLSLDEKIIIKFKTGRILYFDYSYPNGWTKKIYKNQEAFTKDIGWEIDAFEPVSFVDATAVKTLIRRCLGLNEIDNEEILIVHM